MFLGTLNMVLNLSSVFPGSGSWILTSWAWLLVALGIGIARLVTGNQRLTGYFFGACAIALVTSLAATMLVAIFGFTSAALASSQEAALTSLAAAGEFTFGAWYSVATCVSVLCVLFVFATSFLPVKR